MKSHLTSPKYPAPRSVLSHSKWTPHYGVLSIALGIGLCSSALGATGSDDYSGIYIEDGVLSVENSQFLDNEGMSAGYSLFWVDMYSTLVFENSVVWQNDYAKFLPRREGRSKSLLASALMWEGIFR